MQVPSPSSPSLGDLKFLKSSYSRYKEDTNTVASWLAATARSHGYPQHLLENLNTSHKPCSQGTGRLKGKKRKEAKQAAAATTSSSAAQKPAHIIAVKDFVPLATFIAAKRKPLAKVPVYFAEALDRAVNNRKKHGIVAAVFTDSEEANRSHSHFIGILERVKKVLAPFVPKAAKQQTPTTITPMNEFANRFTALHVEEPTAEFLNTPDVETQPSPDFEAEQPDDCEEACTAFQLLCEDVNEIRQVVCNLWVGYKFGQYDLLAISLVTNTAIDFVRALENDVSPLLDKHGGSSELLGSLWNAKQSYMHETEDGLEPDQEEASLYAVSEGVMINAHLLLQKFQKFVGPPSRNSIPFYPYAKDYYDPTSCRESKTPTEKVEEDTVLLHGFLSIATFHIRGVFREETTLEDELIRGLRLVLQTGQIRLHNVLSIQLFLDIHHVLRQDADRPFHEMREAADKIEATIDKTLRFHKYLRPEVWPESCDRAFKNLRTQIDTFIHNDPYRIPGCPEVEEFLLFRRNPILCGLWMYRFQVVAHEIGVLVTGTLGGVLYTCHLYNALHTEKMLKIPWENMETLMELQAESIFGERWPETRDEYLRRFLLATGISASNFAKDSRVRGGIKRSKCLTKGLAWQAPLTRVFRHRYCENSRRVDLTPEELEKIMEKTGTRADDGYEETGIGATDVIIGVDLSQPARSQARREAKGKSKGKAPQRVPMAVLLKRMCNALQGETRELTFDYLHMHRQCWSLLRSIKQESLETFRIMDSSHVLEEEDELPHLVGYILSSAPPESKPSKKASSHAESSGASCPLLAKSANAIEALIQRDEGSLAPKTVFGDCIDRPTVDMSDLGVLPRVGGGARSVIIMQPSIAYHRIG